MSVSKPFPELNSSQLAIRDQEREELIGEFSEMTEGQYASLALFVLNDDLSDERYAYIFDKLSQESPAAFHICRRLMVYGWMEISHALEDKQKELEAMEDDDGIQGSLEGE